MGSVTVLDGGLFTTLQDSGRDGYRKFGVPVSGVMDEVAYKSANKLVNNSEESVVLECTLKGGKYRFESYAVIAITGALMSPKINGHKVAMNTSLEVNTGDILELGFAQKGCRSYVAIFGKWDINKVMGSRSTYTQGKFGGYKGRALQTGDLLRWEAQNHDSDFLKSALPKAQIPYYSSKVTVKFYPGPEWNRLDDKEQYKFLNTSFRINPKSNRMGIRLDSEEPIMIDYTDMTSSGVVPGIVQLPPDGKPIILMKDGQTIGGYPRIGKIPDSEIHRLSQVPLNGTIKLTKCDKII